MVLANAGLIFCMEYLQENMDWLKEQIDPLLKGICSLSGCCCR